MKFDPRLYLITDRTGLTEDVFLHKIEEACIGGVSLVQLREKNSSLARSDRDYLTLAFKVKEITDRYHLPLLIDDRLDIAMILKCGVHLGQTDIPISYAREILGQGPIIGATAKTVAQALEAEAAGADYLGVGAIFPTTTKVKTLITPIETLNHICEQVKIPVMAIGGLTIHNCAILKDSPIDGICVVSAIMNNDKPRIQAQALKKAIDQML